MTSGNGAKALVVVKAMFLMIFLGACGLPQQKTQATATKFIFPNTWTPEPDPSQTPAPTQTKIPPTPLPAGEAVEDRYFIQKCHRWQNVRLDVFSNDSLVLDKFNEVVVVHDVYYFDGEGNRIKRNTGSGSFGEYPALVVRLSQNEVDSEGNAIDGVDHYYIDYQVVGPNQEHTDVAVATLVINEPMSSEWCQETNRKTGLFHQTKRIVVLAEDGELGECELILMDWFEFYVEIQNAENMIVDKVNAEGANHTQNFDTYNNAGWETRALFDRVTDYEHKDHECVAALNEQLALEIHYLLSGFNNACKAQSYEAQKDFYMSDEIRTELQMMITDILPEGWADKEVLSDLVR